MNFHERINPPFFLTAYDIAVRQGFRGSEEAWLRSLVGERGLGFTITGEYATMTDLIAAHAVGELGDVFRVMDTDTIYYWDTVGDAWRTVSFRGPPGERGDRGETGERGEQGDKGEQGEAGIQGERGERGEHGSDGVDGKNGTDGRNFAVLGLYATLEDLIAAQPSPNAGDAFAVGTAASNTIYIFNAGLGEFEDVGPIAGPPGADGADGADGEDGVDGATFTPFVSAESVISFTNNKGLPNPEPMDIRGLPGPMGNEGPMGLQGSAAAPQVFGTFTLPSTAKNVATALEVDLGGRPKAIWTTRPTLSGNSGGFHAIDLPPDTYNQIVVLTNGASQVAYVKFTDTGFSIYNSNSSNYSLGLHTLFAIMEEGGVGANPSAILSVLNVAAVTAYTSLKEFFADTTAVAAIAEGAEMTQVAASDLAMEALVASSPAMYIAAQSVFAMGALAAGPAAMKIIADSEIAMGAVIASETAMTAIVSSATALRILRSRRLSARAIFNSDYAMTRIISDASARALFLTEDNVCFVRAALPLTAPYGFGFGRRAYVMSTTAKAQTSTTMIVTVSGTAIAGTPLPVSGSGTSLSVTTDVGTLVESFRVDITVPGGASLHAGTIDFITV